MTPQRRTAMSLCLMALTALGTMVLLVAKPGERNAAAIQLLHALDMQRSLADHKGALFLEPGLSWNDVDTTPESPCNALWLSRVAASMLSRTDPSGFSQSERYLMNAQDCPRTEFVQRWAGLLAWHTGHKEEAFSHWLVIHPSLLVSWGRSLVLAGEPSLGEALLQTVETRNQLAVLDRVGRTQLYQTLGDLAQQDGAIPKAIDYYEKAWAASGSSYGDMAYQLAASYVSEGRCQQAISVLETGLTKKGLLSFPVLDSSYLILLASCHIQTGNAAKANAYLEAAEEVIQAQRTDVGPEVSGSQQAWLDRMRQELRSSLQDDSQPSDP